MAAADHRDWAELPTDLLGSIAERLTVLEYTRFRAVCNSWASVAGLYLPLAPQTPFLVLPGGDGQPCCTLGSPADGRLHRVAPLPEIQGKWCIGSQDGWLVLLGELSEVSLLNPLTRVQIHLPSDARILYPHLVKNPDGSISVISHRLPTAAASDPTCDDDDVYTGKRGSSFKKVVLSSRPTAGHGYTAVAIFGLSNVLAFVSEGEETWTVLLWPNHIADVMYHGDGGGFLAISDDGKLWALDLAGPSPRVTSVTGGWGRGCEQYDKYLVDSAGDLLQIWIWRVRPGADLPPLTTVTVWVRRLDANRRAWVPLRSLGGRSIFLGLSHSVSLSARGEIPSWPRPDLIYFTEALGEWFSSDDPDGLTARHVAEVNFRSGRFHFYRLPDQRPKCPPPLWFTPALL